MLTRRPRTAARSQTGLTMIELMITVSLVVVLLALAAPPFMTWIRNAKVRTVADSLQNGLRMAQAEALRRNRQVVFSLTNEVPSGTSTAVANGRSWAIHALPLIADEGRDFVEGGPLGDISSGISVTGPASICFNSAGRQTANLAPGVTGASCALDPANPLARYIVAPATAASGDRRLQVTVSLGGQVRLCDPARAIADSPDGCP